VFLHAPSLEGPRRLGPGDLAVMARGCEHVLALQPSLEELTVDSVAAWIPTGVSSGGETATAPQAAVISGAYQLWNRPVHAFFQEMPSWFILSAEEVAGLASLALSVGLLKEEVTQRRLGAEMIVHGLMDVVFTYLLREMLARQARSGASWGQAVEDAPVRMAIGLMHADCAQAWTLDGLAARVGLSRTALAARFRDAMGGDTPMNYLRTVRMQRAARLLSESAQSLEQVALAVGYQDAFGFSKVFKRTLGSSPRDFRRQDQADRLSPWRLHA
jgi:AraC-like DNA-binding protein